MVKNWNRFGRRTFLVGLGTLASIVPFGLTQKFRIFNKQVQGLDDAKNREFPVVGHASLSERAAAKGFIYGAHPEANYKNFSKNAQFQSSFVRECDILVAGFFWGSNSSRPNTYDFTRPDNFAKFASDNKILFRGHPLVWHKSNPKWLVKKFKDPDTTASEIERILTDHVSRLVRHYAGRVHSWDVVNEAINVADGRSDGLRTAPWLKFLGPEYIDLAFRTAAEVDPKALLVYNDNRIAYGGSGEHRAGVLKLLERLKSRGIPIHALGIQAHLFSHKFYRQFDPKRLKTFIGEVADLGLKIMITELDVIDSKLPKDINIRDRMVAAVYEDYLSVVLEEPAVIAVMTWGLSDRYTWISKFAPREDDTPVRPLPLDAQQRRKLAWNAIARAFDKAPKR